MGLLFIDSCISQRGENSRTLRLARAFLEEYRKAHPDDEVTVTRVGNLGLKPLTPADLDARDALARAGDFSGPVFRLARDVQAADKIVVPTFPFKWPSSRRAWTVMVTEVAVSTQPRNSARIKESLPTPSMP